MGAACSWALPLGAVAAPDTMIAFPAAAPAGRTPQPLPYSQADASRPILMRRGVLTDQGIQCQAFRDEAGVLYTLVGDLGGFVTGDHVQVIGRVVAMSICMQGTTLEVLGIASANAAMPALQLWQGILLPRQQGQCLLFQRQDGSIAALLPQGVMPPHRTPGKASAVVSEPMIRSLPCGSRYPWYQLHGLVMGWPEVQ